MKALRRNCSPFPAQPIEENGQAGETLSLKGSILPPLRESSVIACGTDLRAGKQSIPAMAAMRPVELSLCSKGDGCVKRLINCDPSFNSSNVSGLFISSGWAINTPHFWPSLPLGMHNMLPLTKLFIQEGPVSSLVFRPSTRNAGLQIGVSVQQS